MDLIKRLIPIDLYLSLYASELRRSIPDKRVVLSTFLYTFTITHVFIGILFFFINLQLFHLYSKEDGYIEYLTTFYLLAASILCLFKATQEAEKLPRLFFYALALLLFFGFGEEISWGQRIIGFETPENLDQINHQREFNLHNIHLGGVNLNKLIFGKILYTGVFIYFLVFPVLYRSKKWFSGLVDKFGIPLPSPLQSLIYMSCFMGALLIRDGEMWEIQEFILASFIFIIILMPYNKRTFNKTL
jgi:hypothetical protein